MEAKDKSGDEEDYPEVLLLGVCLIGTPLEIWDANFCEAKQIETVLNGAYYGAVLGMLANWDSVELKLVSS